MYVVYLDFGGRAGFDVSYWVAPFDGNMACNESEWIVPGTVTEW